MVAIAFKSFILNGTLNPCIILADFYPGYYAILSDEFKDGIFRGWQDKADRKKEVF